MTAATLIARKHRIDDAAPGNHPAAAELLLKSGANLNARSDGCTAPSIARTNNNDAIVKILVEEGAVPSSDGGCAKASHDERRDVR